MRNMRARRAIPGGAPLGATRTRLTSGELSSLQPTLLGGPMEDQDVPRGARVALGRVDGDLNVDRSAVIVADASGRVLVTGTVRFRGDATIESPFECQQMEVARGTLVAMQELLVHEDLTADEAR